MVSTSIRRAAAKRLRANTTPHERTLWRALKELPVHGTHFRRQAPIGPYVVDFFCPAARLIVELDGAPHDSEERQSRDRVRDEWLREQGYLVLRFANDLVIGGGDIVVDKIRAAIAGLRED